MIGGTSIGSFIGGLYACEQTIDKVDPIAHSWAAQGSSLWFYLMGESHIASLSFTSLSLSLSLSRPHLPHHFLFQRL
jgi:predicted acylesterase/phospholipase RssA